MEACEADEELAAEALMAFRNGSHEGGEEVVYAGAQLVAQFLASVRGALKG